MITTTAKIIKTEKQYFEYFEEVQELINKSPNLGTEESEKLELLSVLIENYELQKHPIEPPDPIDAILFRMNEKGLRQADLVRYFGTRSRVSEVLARKRPLTVPMIKALSIGLGISAEVLIGLEQIEQKKDNSIIDWSKFPIKEMITRGWIKSASEKPKQSPEEIVKNFIKSMGLQTENAAFRRTLSGDALTQTTTYTLHAWLARVIQKSREDAISRPKYNHTTISDAFIKKLIKLSTSISGPKLAVELIKKQGIAVVIEPQLKGTMLDGAALMDTDGTPIIALTLRHDRLDNFWFTLTHELAHIWKHIKSPDEVILDDLEHSSDDKREAEANRIARDAFIPRSLWKSSDAYLSPSRESILSFSKELKIHPAIVAGRLRKETGNFNQFTDLIGHGEVRKHFENI
ncbi:ImmA/IrrE family metallo-endopeptidase [Pseudomonas putida]|jgi:HTH-type transcriptional regulator/antitoxin HigA|uniref:ImmA/IrrE family metallo-endopeptidase n=1 Tax=Pseudomonas TaxID=286 RepID=UPI000BA2D06A|nr:ImmA/IrrE family metallo-endopeptidase [Pseudomonas sp. Irchel s3a10]